MSNNVQKMLFNYVDRDSNNNSNNNVEKSEMCKNKKELNEIKKNNEIIYEHSAAVVKKKD